MNCKIQFYLAWFGAALFGGFACATGVAFAYGDWPLRVTLGGCAVVIFVADVELWRLTMINEERVIEWQPSMTLAPLLRRHADAVVRIQRCNAWLGDEQADLEIEAEIGNDRLASVSVPPALLSRMDDETLAKRIADVVRYAEEIDDDPEVFGYA